jgi:uncharacterized protein (DUF58 family)
MADQRSRADLMDPTSLAALGSLEVVARWVVEGFMTGLHRSPKKGFSVEFAEHRGYQPGDDLRYLDWKVVARADKWLIKQFEEETNLRATIVLDVSKSMHWTGDPNRITKLAYAERMAAAIAWLLLRQRDAVGMIRFDDEVRSVIPPRARTQHWRRIVTALEDPGAGTGSDAPGALKQVAQLVTRPGMVIFISDLLVNEDEAGEAIAMLRAVGHDVTVLHVMDPVERDLGIAKTDVELKDTESPLKLFATVNEAKAMYRETVDEILDEWRGRVTRTGAAYATVFTDQPFGIGVRQAFSARQGMP